MRGERGGRGGRQMPTAMLENSGIMKLNTSPPTPGGLVSPVPGFIETLHDRQVREQQALQGQGKNGYYIDRGRQLVWLSPGSYDNPTVYGPSGVPGVYEVIYRALWGSPLFDLREDLFLQSGEAGGTQPIQRSAQFGIQWYLDVQIQGLGYAELQANTNLRVSWIQRTHPNQPTQAVYTSAPVDCTTAFNAGNEGVWLSFPVTSPIRYWGLTLVFDLIQPLGQPLPVQNTNPVSIYASLH